MWQAFRSILLGSGLVMAPFAGAGAVSSPDFSLKALDFKDEDRLPVSYTCDGTNVSPAFQWSKPPAGTKSLVLICADPDAPSGTWYHWVLYNLPPDTHELTEGVTSLPKGSITGINSWGDKTYGGACPPAGSTHRYIFTLYALKAPIAISRGEDTGEGVLQAMQGQIIAATSQTATYSR